jgi:hypothetical protein
MDSSSERVDRWRKRAEECRALAEVVKTATAQKDYLNIADVYERLANTSDLKIPRGIEKSA